MCPQVHKSPPLILLSLQNSPQLHQDSKHRTINRKQGCLLNRNNRCQRKIMAFFRKMYLPWCFCKRRTAAGCSASTWTPCSSPSSSSSPASQSQNKSKHQLTFWPSLSQTDPDIAPANQPNDQSINPHHAQTYK